MTINLSEEMVRTLLSAVKIAKYTTTNELGDSVAGLKAMRKLEEAGNMLRDMLGYK